MERLVGDNGYYGGGGGGRPYGSNPTTAGGSVVEVDLEVVLSKTVCVNTGGGWRCKFWRTRWFWNLYN